MKQIQTLFSMVSAIALLALMAGCATTASFPQDKANMLVAAGFKTVTPKTPRNSKNSNKCKLAR